LCETRTKKPALRRVEKGTPPHLAKAVGVISSIERFRGTPSPSDQSDKAILNSVFNFNLPCYRNNNFWLLAQRRIGSLDQMIFSNSASKKLTPEQESILRAHWEWAGGYAKFWIIVTVLLFGGMFLAFDYFGADDSVRIHSIVLLATIILVNAIWRAVGALAAHLDLMSKRRQDHDKLRLTNVR
jgi:hypothetical protein